MQGFPEPEKFDPDRMDPAGRAEDVKYRGNYLPFGCGPHYCVGREYAMNHLITFLAVFATSVKWERVKDGGCVRFSFISRRARARTTSSCALQFDVRVQLFVHSFHFYIAVAVGCREKRIVYLPTLYPGTCIVRMAPFQQ